MSDVLLPKQIEQTTEVMAQNTYVAQNQFFGAVKEMSHSITILGDNNGNWQQIELSKVYYNLFVIKDEIFDGWSGSFSILKRQALDYQALSDADKQTVLTFPSLFMDTNKAYRACANPGQQFYYGKVDKIYEQGKCYKVYYQKISPARLLQQDLAVHSVALGININDGRDIMDETGWRIKKLDLRKALMNTGIYI